jgi:hypothetical protein
VIAAVIALDLALALAHNWGWGLGWIASTEKAANTTAVFRIVVKQATATSAAAAVQTRLTDLASKRCGAFRHLCTPPAFHLQT